MRRAIALITLVLAIVSTGVTALASSEVECRNGDIEWLQTTPLMRDRNPTEANGIYWGINGHFLWYQFSEEAPKNPERDARSVEVTEGVTGVSVCANGTVTLSSNALEIANYNKPTTTTTTGEEPSTTATTTTTASISTTSTTGEPSTTVTSTLPSTTSSTTTSTTSSLSPTTTDPAPTTSVLSESTTTVLTELPFTGISTAFGFWVAGVSLLIGTTMILILWWGRRDNS